MLAFIQGQIIASRPGYIIILAGDLGYQIFVNENLQSTLTVGTTAELYLYQQIKEDGVALYGFVTLAEREFFELLISVSGVGPKSASAMLAAFGGASLRQAIGNNEVAVLTQAPGIGRRTAERLILELRDKIIKLGEVDETVRVGNWQDELAALVSLGYSAQQARAALQAVDDSVVETGERIRVALRNIK